jgi:hypothetical protein
MNVYGMLKMPSLEDGYLYHFTKPDSLFEIIKNMTLKLSTFKDLNDLNEKEIKFNWGDWQNGLKVKKFIVENCRLLSFSQNFERAKSNCHCGCNHPRMWAQYADNNKGACVVINEKLFIEKNIELLDKYFWRVKNVSYKEYVFNDENIEISNPEEFTKKNYEKLFFEKYIDWLQEDERRLFVIGNVDYLSIDGCIEFVCLGNKFESQSYSKLAEILVSNLNKEFALLRPHDFSFQLNADGRSLPMDNTYRIVEYLRKTKGGANYLSHFEMN